MSKRKIECPPSDLIEDYSVENDIKVQKYILDRLPIKNLKKLKKQFVMLEEEEYKFPLVISKGKGVNPF